MTAALEWGEWSAAWPGRTLPAGKTRYPFYRRLGRPQGRSGGAENLVPTGIRSRTVQPVDQLLYRLSYPAQTQIQNYMKIRPVDADLFHADRRKDEHTAHITNLIVVFAILRMRPKRCHLTQPSATFYSKNTQNMLVSRGMFDDKVQCFLTTSSKCNLWWKNALDFSRCYRHNVWHFTFSRW